MRIKKAGYFALTYCDLLYFANYKVGPVCKNVLRKSVNCEFIFIKKGTGKLFMGGSQFDIFQNELITVPADVYFRIECKSSIEYFCAGFAGDNLTDKILIAKDDNYIVYEILKIMEKEFRSQQSCRKEMMNLLLNCLIVISCRLSGTCENKKNIEKENFNFIINFMKAKSHTGVDMEQIAGMSGLSYHRFRHRFKELTGISPQQFIIKQRIDFAKSLLENTKCNTTAIALSCGFRSVPQFITCFNKQLGVTPVRYRRMFILQNQPVMK